MEIKTETVQWNLVGSHTLNHYWPNCANKIPWYNEEVTSTIKVPEHKIDYPHNKIENLRNIIKSTFTWDPKWIQTGSKSQTALKFHSVYMAIYMEISLR